MLGRGYDLLKHSVVSYRNVRTRAADAHARDDNLKYASSGIWRDLHDIVHDIVRIHDIDNVLISAS